MIGKIFRMLLFTIVFFGALLAFGCQVPLVRGSSRTLR
jgi:Mg2+/citrate symporter